MPGKIETEDVTLLENFITTSDVCRIFDRSPLTISNWRKRERLPYVRIKGTGRDTIRYDRKRVRQWAKEQGKQIHTRTRIETAGTDNGRVSKRNHPKRTSKARSKRA